MNCKRGAINLIDQIINVIEMIPEGQYALPLDIFNGSTLGKHFRHISDFFDCLINQCDCALVDYASRNRDNDIEEIPEYAISKFGHLKGQIEKLNEEETLKVYADFQLEDGTRPVVTTTIGRELMYAYDHAVHHLAIVKIGLKSNNPDVQIPQSLGVAASTIKHQFEVSHGHSS